MRCFRFVPALSRKLALLPFWLLIAALLAACGDSAASSGAPTPVAAPANTVVSAPAPTNTTAGSEDIPAPTDTVAVPPTATPAPPPTDTAVPATATPASARLALVEYTQYKDSLNDVVVIGYVRNEGSVPLESIKVVAQALDSGGATVGTGEDLLLALVQLPPGKVAPFQVSLGQLTGTLDKIDVQTQAAPFDPNGFNIFTAAQGLTVEGEKLGQPQQYLGTKLTGRIKNGGTTPATLVRVLAVAYGADGKVVDVGEGSSSLDPLAPGASGPFEITFRRDG